MNNSVLNWRASHYSNSPPSDEFERLLRKMGEERDDKLRRSQESPVENPHFLDIVIVVTGPRSRWEQLAGRCPH